MRVAHVIQGSVRAANIHDQIRFGQQAGDEFHPRLMYQEEMNIHAAVDGPPDILGGAEHAVDHVQRWTLSQLPLNGVDLPSLGDPTEQSFKQPSELFGDSHELYCSLSWSPPA